MTAHPNATVMTPYSDLFFDAREHKALQSARLVAPVVLSFISPSSILDVGCGRGEWLRAFQELGVGAVRGLDGKYVEPSKLLVPQHSFVCTDLSKPFEVPGRYDLAVCLEVAEHLPAEMASSLVAKLVEAAPAVLFSAALPGQGGTHHINERMPRYWRTLFARHRYVLLDAIRPAILTDTRIAWWYRQNTVLYASENLIRTTPGLAAYRVPDEGLGIDWVHAYVLDNRESVRALTKQLLAALGKALRRRVDLLLRLPRPKPQSSWPRPAD